MKLGRVFGIAFIVLGVIFTWFAYTMLRDANFTMKFLTAGPALALLGLGFAIFPGGNITAKESKTKAKNPGVMFSEAPKAHIIAWVIFFAVGCVLSYLLFR
jgi:hypothetical protein